MKQNSTNVFNDGLNYDLNPITTPNNVLTDCVNGTFITFNGDELALQNDAGNTKIAIPGSDPVEYVTLTEGFLPLGIKEYGGVLYIVSVKTPDTTLWVEWIDEEWFEGDIVYKEVLNKTVYYRSTRDNDVLPESNPLYWETLGSKTDAINKLSEIEFGSYPSPEGADVRIFPGLPRTYDSLAVPFDSKLYKKLIINEAIFKSSRYIIFDGVNSEDIDISRVSGLTKSNTQIVEEKLFWKMKLFHYLNNGYLELTENIEERYREYLRGTTIPDGIHHWFTDDSFRYYCPSLFKGPLAMSLEIESLTTFELYGYPGFSFNGATYRFELNIIAVGAGLITVPQARVEIWIGGVIHDFGTDEYYEDIDIDQVTNLGNFVLSDIDIASSDTEFKYRITPIIEVEGTKYAEGRYEDAYNDLPQEYVNEFVITGARLVDTKYDDIVFKLDEATWECIPGVPYREYSLVTLQTEGGDYLDLSLAPTATPHIFLRQDLWDAVYVSEENNYDTINSVVTIATFQTGTAENFNFYPEEVIVKQSIYDVIITMFKNVVVIKYEYSCIAEGTFIPFLVGVNSTGIIHILSDTGVYKFAIAPGMTHPDNDSDVQMLRNAVDYDSDDKLVFVGGKEGYLTIIEIENPEVPIYKEISITSDDTELVTVRIIEDNAGAKVLYIATKNGKIFKQTYYDTADAYIAELATEILIDKVEEYIRDFNYFSGYVYAIGTRFEHYRVKTNELASGFIQFNDLLERGYKIIVGQQYMWWLGFYDQNNNGKKEDERIVYYSKLLPNSDDNNLQHELPHPNSTNQYPTDYTLLKNDDFLVYDTRGGQGVWQTGGLEEKPVFLFSDLWPDPSVTDATLFTGGGCFDGNKYAYISSINKVGLFDFNPTYSLWKYNAYPENEEAIWEHAIGVDENGKDKAIGFYERLFIY